MVQVEVALRLARIKEFGYFPLKTQKVGEGASERKLSDEEAGSFGDLASTLDDLRGWLSRQQHLGATATCEPDSGLRMFGSSVAHAGTTWCLSLVEEVPRGFGGAGVFNLGAPPAASQVAAHRVDPTRELLGVSAHFWFLPSLSLCGGIKIGDGSWPSAGKMERYVRGFMARYAKLCESSAGSDDIIIRSPSGLSLRCWAKFVRESEIDVEAQSEIFAGTVHGVLLREVVPTYLPTSIAAGSEQPKQPGFRGKLLEFFKSGADFSSVEGTPTVVEEDEARVEVRIARKPTKTQITQMIDGWEAQSDGWSNLGFLVKKNGNQKPVWLKGRPKVVKVVLDLPLDNRHGLMDTTALAAQLSKHEDTILSALSPSEGANP